jgi:hypothetical protein
LTGPPQIISKSPANITQLVETNVTLVCTVIANPNPTTFWKRMDPDGKFIEIKRTSKKFDGNHTIYNARLEDSGKYLCNASNTLGYDSYTTQITIKPGKLTKLGLVARASSLGPGTHGTGSARKLAVVSKAHALELGRFSTRNNFHSEALRRNEVFVLTYVDRIILPCENCSTSAK